MKFLILFASLFTTANAFAVSPFVIIKCLSDNVTVEVFSDGCSGSYKLKEVGFNPINENVTCGLHPEKEFFMEVNLNAEINQLNASIISGSDTLMLLASDAKLINTEEKSAVKRYSMKADLYRISKTTDSTRHKDVECEVDAYQAD